ncbi:MAG: hypothetical protein K2X81_05855 [Candidatus Obscuribacterales bacterium]|nr:hypothetical protein [Candidatus Obscuribacterales bacterium]
MIKTHQSLLLIVLSALIFLYCAVVPLSGKDSRFSTISNDLMEIGVDRLAGGAIGFLGDREHGNIVNCDDKGRYIQQSYYSGPKPYGKSSPHWPDWSWNPITAGDDYGNAGEILELKNDGKSIYVKSIPKQWALNNVPGECIFETWITLAGNVAHVKQRLTNQRKDKTNYGAYPQELPALYTVGKLYRLFSYCGDAPFENQPLKEIHDDKKDFSAFRATESWAAEINDKNWGLGICHPGVYDFRGGFRGKAGRGGPFDASTGYIAPLRQEILDHNIVYEYNYCLILGKLDEIRKQANALCPHPALPDYHFVSDRQHWTYNNTRDSGFPTKGSLKIDLSGIDPSMQSGETFWSAKDVPKLYVYASYHCAPGIAEIFFKGPSQAFSQDRSCRFEIIADGQFHWYEIDLSKVPTYSGIIDGIRFDPTFEGKPGDSVDVAVISYKSPTN